MQLFRKEKPRPGDPRSWPAAATQRHRGRVSDPVGAAGRRPICKIVIITGQDDKENALKAIGQGASDFFCKPIVMNELKVVLQRALTVYQLERKTGSSRTASAGRPLTI